MDDWWRFRAVPAVRLGMTPFPIPAHRTGRAVFRLPALRLVSRESIRRAVRYRPADAMHPQLAEDPAGWELSGSPRREVVTALQRAPDAVVDVPVHRPVGIGDRSVGKVHGPTTQDVIEPVPDVLPGSGIAGLEDLPNLVLDPKNALLRRAGAKKPIAVGTVPVQAKAVPEKIEPLLAGIP